MNNRKKYITQIMRRKDMNLFGWGMFALGAFFGLCVALIVVLLGGGWIS